MSRVSKRRREHGSDQKKTKGENDRQPNQKKTK